MRYYDADESVKTLKGERVKEVWKYRDDHLKFVCESGKVVWWSAVGSCCSSSWFEHVDVEAMRDAEVVEDIQTGYVDAVERRDDGGYDVLQIYKYTVTTTRGHCDFEMRNSSNGYYSGWIIAYSEPLDQHHSLLRGDLGEGIRIL
jgi:hypothetical protein